MVSAQGVCLDVKVQVRVRTMTRRLRFAAKEMTKLLSEAIVACFGIFGFSLLPALAICTSRVQQYKKRRHIFSIKRCASLQMHVWRRCEVCQLGCVWVHLKSSRDRMVRTHAQLREQASCARTCFRRVRWELCRGRGASTSRAGPRSPR